MPQQLPSFFRLLPLLWGLPLLVGLSACDDDNFGPRTPRERLVEEMRYPLEAGQTWEYRSEIRRDFATHTVYDKATSRVHALGMRTLPGGQQAYLLEKVDDYGEGEPVVHRSYLTNREDGLFLHAYTTGEPKIFFKQAPEAPQFVFQGRAFATLQGFRMYLKQGYAPGSAASNKTGKTQDGELVVLKEPALSLAYKPFIGTEWPLQSPANNAANGQKRITSIDSLFLPSGIETLALRVRVRYDRDGDGNLDPNLEVFQYFDRGGLVKIEWTAYDVMMHDPATNSQKRGTYHETTWLTGQFED